MMRIMCAEDEGYRLSDATSTAFSSADQSDNSIESVDSIASPLSNFYYPPLTS